MRSLLKGITGDAHFANAEIELLSLLIRRERLSVSEAHGSINALRVLQGRPKVRRQTIIARVADINGKSVIHSLGWSVETVRHEEHFLFIFCPDEERRREVLKEAEERNPRKTTPKRCVTCGRKLPRTSEVLPEVLKEREARKEAHEAGRNTQH